MEIKQRQKEFTQVKAVLDGMNVEIPQESVAFKVFQTETLFDLYKLVYSTVVSRNFNATLIPVLDVFNGAFNNTYNVHMLCDRFDPARLYRV